MHLKHLRSLLTFSALCVGLSERNCWQASILCGGLTPHTKHFYDGEYRARMGRAALQLVEPADRLVSETAMETALALDRWWKSR